VFPSGLKEYTLFTTAAKVVKAVEGTFLLESVPIN
jgi:hypothetical protein